MESTEEKEVIVASYCLKYGKIGEIGTKKGTRVEVKKNPGLPEDCLEMFVQCILSTSRNRTCFSLFLECMKENCLDGPYEKYGEQIYRFALPTIRKEKRIEIESDFLLKLAFLGIYAYSKYRERIKLYMKLAYFRMYSGPDEFPEDYRNFSVTVSEIEELQEDFENHFNFANESEKIDFNICCRRLIYLFKSDEKCSSPFVK